MIYYLECGSKICCSKEYNSDVQKIISPNKYCRKEYWTTLLNNYWTYYKIEVLQVLQVTKKTHV